MSARVSFVGAGPGPADLLTVRALRVLAQAEVVLADALVGEEIRTLAPQARWLDVGKRAGRTSVAQAFTSRCLVAEARRHRLVVRLKGGDPGIFARLEEETAALRRAGIEYEVVPGITAACAASAEVGVSLTQRGVARSLCITTPSCGEGEAANAWLESAAGVSTLAIYMAGREIGATARSLLAAGRAPDTPMLVLESAGAGNPAQRFSLSEAACLPPANRAGPVVLLVGEVLAAARAEPDTPCSAQRGRPIELAG